MKASVWCTRGLEASGSVLLSDVPSRQGVEGAQRSRFKEFICIHFREFTTNSESNAAISVLVEEHHTTVQHEYVRWCAW